MIVPNKLAFFEDKMIGLSNSESPGLPKNQNYLYLIENGMVKQKVKLEDGTTDLTIFNGKIFVLHAAVSNPFIEEINISDFESRSKIELTKNPTNIFTWENNLVVVDNHHTLLLFDKHLEKTSEHKLDHQTRVFDMTSGDIE